MFILYEPQCKGMEHAEINASFLIFLINSKPGKVIEFYGDGSHLSAVKSTMDFLQYGNLIKLVVWHSVEIQGNNGGYIQRIKQETRRLIALVLTLLKHKKKCEKVILLSATNSTLLGVKLIQRKYRVPIFVVLHGVLETIKERPKSFIKRILWFREYLTLNNKSNIKYITTASFIKENLVKELPCLKNKVFSLDMPYLFNEVDTHWVNRKHMETAEPKRFLNVTCAGVGSRLKGTDKFFLMAESIYKKKCDLAKFIYAGRLADENLKDLIPTCVEAHVDKNMLSTVEYDQIMRKTDYLVFFYPEDSYKFGVSGVFLDAVKYEIPIFAIRNEFFEYCNDVMGMIGWLCNTQHQMEELVLSVVNADNKSVVRKIKQNYQNYKKNNNLKKHSLRLLEILDYEQ